jgi:hypothetical protein
MKHKDTRDEKSIQNTGHENHLGELGVDERVMDIESTGCGMHSSGSAQTDPMVLSSSIKGGNLFIS